MQSSLAALVGPICRANICESLDSPTHNVRFMQRVWSIILIPKAVSSVSPIAEGRAPHRKEPAGEGLSALRRQQRTPV